MDVIYKVLETILPFSFMNYAFMKNAFLAIILVSPIFAILGTMIVNNKMAFFSDALGHSALTGISLGIILGISNINISMGIFAVIFAIILNKIKRSNLLYHLHFIYAKKNHLPDI
jgi:zinc transport system permease protein